MAFGMIALILVILLGWPQFGLMAILGPIEEFGWRDLLQPILQRKYAPFWGFVDRGIYLGYMALTCFLPFRAATK